MVLLDGGLGDGWVSHGLELAQIGLVNYTATLSSFYKI